MSNNKKMAIVAIVGLLFALLTASMLSGGKKKPVDDSNFVLVTKSNLQPGTFIKINDHLAFIDMRGKSEKPEWLRKKDINISNFEGAVVRSLLKAGEPLDKAKVVTPKEGGFMSAVLYPGMRAISVGVNVVSANAGFIFPGDRVDLLLTHEIGSTEGNTSHVTETVTENVRVLAIDQQVNNVNNKAFVPKTVTLEVTPKQAEEILVAQELGKISLILRSQGGSETLTEKTFTRDSDVSKVIHNSRPGVEATEVTVTRGKPSGNK